MDKQKPCELTYRKMREAHNACIGAIISDDPLLIFNFPWADTRLSRFRCHTETCSIQKAIYKN